MAPEPLTGVLLVGGASRRFGSPKALAEVDGETLAERAWRLLEPCDERVAVGKAADALVLPFPILDDGVEMRAPIAGVVAGLRAASNELCVVVPVDCPFLTWGSLLALADACEDVSFPPTGPLPGAYRRSSLPALEASLDDGELALRKAVDGLRARVVELDPRELANVNTRADLETVRTATPPR